MRGNLWPLGILLATNLFAAEITTLDGDRYEGKITSENEQEIVLTDSQGVEKKFLRERVRKIIYLDDQPRFKKQYWAFGFTLGTPAAFNVNAWHMWNDFGVQVSGGYWGSAYGAQANFAWKLGDYETFAHNLVAGTGTFAITVNENSVDKTNRWTYGLIGYNLNWHGVFLEVDILLGAGSYSNPQLGAQLGYIYRLNVID